MISSTIADLREYREQARSACEQAGFTPYLAENFAADNVNLLDASLKAVEDADVFLCILGRRYGYVPGGSDTSITEMEFNHATRLNKPILVFAIHDDSAVRMRDLEGPPERRRLQALKDRLQEQTVVGFFHSPENLRKQILEGLFFLRKQLDEAGRPREKIPAPPEPYIAHNVAASEFVGRQTELGALTRWISQSETSPIQAPVFCILALGGMGKSALAWKWFVDLVPHRMPQVAGKLWWSFYENDDFGTFVDHALCYVTGLGRDTVRSWSADKRTTQLLKHLNEKPYLFVLDGIERILNAYHRANTSGLLEEESDTDRTGLAAASAGLPQSAIGSFAGKPSLRQAFDPVADQVLASFASLARSRILITTRLFPRCLQEENHQPRAGCILYHLHGLNNEDAFSLFQFIGVKGSKAELAPIVESIEGHPLLLQILGTEVARYPSAPGNFAAWRQAHPDILGAAAPSIPRDLNRVNLVEPPATSSGGDAIVLSSLSEFYKLADYGS